MIIDEAFRANNPVPIRDFTQYPEVGHFFWLGAYSDPQMMEWLFRQHK
jgi:hypothetical protein